MAAVLSILSLSLFALPSQAQTRFDAQIRSALQEDGVRTATSSRTVPPTGSSQTVSTQPASPAGDDSANQPYNAGYDFESGVVAAGGAILAAVIIILLFWLVASSRHHDHE